MCAHCGPCEAKKKSRAGWLSANVKKVSVPTARRLLHSRRLQPSDMAHESTGVAPGSTVVVSQTSPLFSVLFGASFGVFFFFLRIWLHMGWNFFGQIDARAYVNNLWWFPNKYLTRTPRIWVFQNPLFSMYFGFPEIRVKDSTFFGVFSLGWIACDGVRLYSKSKFNLTRFDGFYIFRNHSGCLLCCFWNVGFQK
jgi:hypothetical protein